MNEIDFKDVEFSDIELSEKYQPLFDIPIAREMAEKSDNPYWAKLSKVSIIIMTGGRFSVKSFAKSMAEVVWCADYEYNILSTRFTNASLEDSVIPDTTEKVELLGLEDEFHIVKNRAIHIPTNSKIVFKGVKASSKNQTANLKSLKDFTSWWVEEAEEHDSHKSWETTYLSIRDSKKQVISGLVLNPASKEHWVYKEFFEKRGIPSGFNGIKDEILYIHTTYLDCPRQFIPDNIFQYFERMRVENPKKYEHIVMGGWLDKAEGVIFDNWKIGPFPNDVDHGFGLDFGFSVDPDALVRCHIDKKHKKIYLKEELYKSGLGSEMLAKHLTDICGNKQIVADNAEGRLISDLRTKKLNIIPCTKGAGSIVAGIKIMQDYEIIIDPASINLIKEFNNYVWDDKKIEKPIDAYNHLIDACRYYITRNTRNTDIWAM